MVNYNQMLKQFNSLQKKMEEDKKKLEEKEFISKIASNMIEIKILGNKKIKEINIDEGFMKQEDTKTITTLLTNAINSIFEDIDREEGKILSSASSIPGLCNFLK